MRNTSLVFALTALLLLTVADIGISTAEPGRELARMALGLVNPQVVSWSTLLHSLGVTLAFALQGVTLAAVAGFGLALIYRHRWVRALCAFCRSVHELFWALLLMQLAGLSTLTGLLAIAIPYAGTLAKIYGELFEEADPAPGDNIPRSAPTQGMDLSVFVYTVLPAVWRPMLDYTRYRFECGIRSSAVLGFIGLPTLGFHLESTLLEGQYAAAAGLLYALLLLIVSLRFWLHLKWMPVYLLAALYWLPPAAQLSWEVIIRFLSEDIVPAPLRAAPAFTGGELAPLWDWLLSLVRQQLLPGLANTLVLSQIALVFTALIALALFPLNSPVFLRRGWRALGDGLLIVLRTLPQYLLAFIGLLALGPSMLPAIIALGVHNGAIIAHLVGRHSASLQRREDAPTGIDGYFFEVLPRVYRQFLAFLFYRWEVILRESAILGMLGIATLGFYIDSAFEEFRFDRALVLILASAALNMGADRLARHLRLRLHLKTTPESL